MSQEVSCQINFTINGRSHTVDASIPWDTSLNTYIRYYVHLRGSKTMCHEGGCGCCVVAVKSRNVFTGQEVTYAVNSCLIPVFSCHGRDVITVEGIGSRRRGYHALQSRLAEFNGSQCGFCSPGMVMNMYSLLESGPVTMQLVEDSFGGNICRCTGYRPILDAFKSFSVDATKYLTSKVQDIEDSHKSKNCQNCPVKKQNEEKCSVNCETEYEIVCKDGEENIYSVHITPVHLHLKGFDWYKVLTIKDILQVFSRAGNAPYMLIAGNTARGVYQMTVTPHLFIDVQDVQALKSYQVGTALRIGGNMTLTEIISLFKKISQEKPNFLYLRTVAYHISLIANLPVRNVGTIAGNLTIKYEHNEFPSDMFLLMATVGATLEIVSPNDTLKNVSLPSFLDLNMKHRIILSVTLPPLDEKYKLKTYKIMQREQNSHAYVNAGFLFKLDVEHEGRILETPTIVYGGINPRFIHAGKTEEFLTNANLFNPAIIRKALQILESEINPDFVLPEASPLFRKRLAVALFYKFVLSLKPPGLPKRCYSGGYDLIRPLSSGKQEYKTIYTEWPLTKPVQKLTAYAQTSGEAQYINDLPTLPREAYAAFVLSTVGQGYIENIDPREALKIPGVIKFLTAKDIPGINTFVGVGLKYITENEEVFCSGKVKYAGQPVGLIVAASDSAALTASLRVKVSYIGTKTPKLNLREVITSGDRSRIRVQHRQPETSVQITDSVEFVHEIQGSFDLGSQYHFAMENHACLCIPVEDGLDVYTSCQWMDIVQVAIAQALRINECRINVKACLVGGAFGGKVSRHSLVATACALAAYVTDRPVRFVLDLQSTMKSLGKRCDFSMDYWIKTDAEGKIKFLKINMYENVGSSWNEPLVNMVYDYIKNCYNDENWDVTGYSVRLDVPSMTFCRAPGALEGIAAIENIMEHIAKVVKKDPLEIRLVNMTKDNKLHHMIKDLKGKANYDERKKAVDVFNKNERWRKKGISLMGMNYPIKYFGGHYALVSVYAGDGTVAVSHGGVEIGQGISTKVAQAVAYMLKIPLEWISVKPSNSLIAPNDAGTVGSIKSDACAIAAVSCCRELLKRMEPAKKGLKNPTWQEWVRVASLQNVDLCVVHMFPSDETAKNYIVYGATVTESVIDLLTGQHQIVRVDILEDAGNSISPEIDIGQIEGSFIMGMGYWLLEFLVFHPGTGELLTNRTWNYKVPGAKDIPVDFRVYMLKNSPNPTGVLRSKATGEPPMAMSCSVYFALRHALSEARKEAGMPDIWFKMDLPATVENVFLASLTNPRLFDLKDV